MSNVEIIRAVYEAFSRRDMTAVFELISPNAKAVQSTALPWGGEYIGANGLVEFLTRLMRHVDSRIEPERFIDAGDHVVAIGRTKGTVRATGKSFDVPVVHVWRIEASKVTAFNPYIENAEMLKALQS